MNSLVFCLLAFSQEVASGSSMERIAYARLTEGSWQIWTIAPDGSEPRQWTADSSDKRGPCWHPDGTTLTYNDAEGRLHALGADGGAVRIPAMAAASECDISATGRIAQQCVRYAPEYLIEIWTSNLDGSERRSLTHQPVRQLAPSWSPDGRHLVVAEYDPRTESFCLTRVTDSDGAREVLLTDKHRFVAPCWSPDGKSIAFAKDLDGNHDLWSIDSTTRELRQLTSHPDLDSSPSYSPDGRELVFVSRRDGSLQLWKMPSQGGTPVQLTRGVPCRDPSWSPRITQGVPLELGQPRISSLANGAGGPVHLDFALSKDARVQWLISGEDQAPVASSEPVLLSAGSNRVSWDGLSDSGSPVGAGVYLLRLVAAAEDERVEWNPSVTTGGEVVTAQNLLLSGNERTVCFDVPSASRVRVRFGLEGGPMCRTLVDFEPMAPGRKCLPFDGELAVGWGNFWDHPDRQVSVTAYALPSNAIVVTGPGIPGRRCSGFAGLELREGEISRHAQHSANACRDPELTVRLVGVDALLRRDASGLPIAKGEVVLRIDMPNPEDKALFETSRFEVMIFLDDFFLAEDEDSVLPFSYRVDLDRFPDGEHAFLVNVGGYQDHIGAVFVPFRIDRSSE